MNARLLKTSPESLNRHADNYAAWCELMLDNGNQYFDLQMAAMKSSIALARQHLSADIEQQTPENVLKACGTLVHDSLGEMASFVRQSGALSSATQRELGRLLGIQWEHGKEWLGHFAEGQVNLIQALSPQTRS